MGTVIKNNIFMIVVAIGYTIYIANHYINMKRLGGEKTKDYNHNSGIKITGYIMIFIGILYAVLFYIDKRRSLNTAVTAILFIYFVILVAYISIRKINIYENGMYYAGKFILFSDILSVQKLNKNGIQINLNKKGLSSMLYMSKVENENEFIGELRRHIKGTKKKKKK